MRCTHEKRLRGVLGNVGNLRRKCLGELEYVESVEIEPREAIVDPDPSAVQRWDVYLCPRNHETRILANGAAP